jgi:hypothetical protein
VPTQNLKTQNLKLETPLVVLDIRPTRPSEPPQTSSINVMSANPVNNEQLFAEAALEHWRQLGEELRSDVDQFNRKSGSATFSQPSAEEYRISNSESGLEVRVVVDPQDHLAHYDFVRTNDHSAGAPEGGILSMRMGRNGVEFYSSDQPVTASEARGLLLDPVLSPSQQ